MFCATINADNEHLRKYYPNAEKLISRSEIIELSKHNSEIREKILISERKAENDTTGNYNFIRLRPYLDIKFWQKVEENLHTLEPNQRIELLIKLMPYVLPKVEGISESDSASKPIQWVEIKSY